MISTWIKVYFLVIMNLDNGLQVYSDNFPCSCYNFNGRIKPWSEGEQECRTQGGNLVSMETVEEWEFIKTQIQNRTTEPNGHNEWWIGLEEKDGKWEWLSNHTLTYNKWQPGEPRGNNGDECVVIAKNYPENTYGLLNNAGCGLWRGWICEYKIKDCSNNQAKWCKNPVTPTVMRGSKTDPEAITTTATSDFARDSSTNTLYNNNKPIQQQTTPFQVHKENGPITTDHHKLTNTDCLPYPLLVTAIFVNVLGGLTVLAAVAFFLVPFVLKKSRSSSIV